MFLRKLRKKLFRGLLDSLPIDDISAYIADTEFIKIRNRFMHFGKDSLICYPWNRVCGHERISIGDNFHANTGLFLGSYGPPGDTPIIAIGDNVVINFDSQITAINCVRIGNNVLTGSRILISDHSHGAIDFASLSKPPIQRELVSKGPVIIGNNVWMGSGVAIMPGVTIGDNCIIGANSVVTKSFPENSVIGGNPAKLIKTLGPDN